MGIGNIVGGIAQGVDRGIDTVSHVQDMWKRQDETKLRDMEMQRLQQPFDYTTLPIYNDLDEVGRAKVDKAFAGLPEKWRGTQGGADMVLKNLVNDSQMIDSLENVFRKQAEAHVINLQKKLEVADKNGDRRLAQEVQAELRVALPKAMTRQQTIDTLRLNLQVQDLLKDMPDKEKRELKALNDPALIQQAILAKIKARAEGSNPTSVQKNAASWVAGNEQKRKALELFGANSGSNFSPSVVDAGGGEPKAPVQTKQQVGNAEKKIPFIATEAQERLTNGILRKGQQYIKIGEHKIASMDGSIVLED